MWHVIGRTVTSGGTESILLTVKTARDYYLYIRPDIMQEEIILPVTAHAAFHKSAGGDTWHREIEGGDRLPQLFEEIHEEDTDVEPQVMLFSDDPCSGTGSAIPLK